MSVGRADIFTFLLTDAEALQSRGAVNKTGLCCIITAVRLRSVSQREASLLQCKHLHIICSFITREGFYTVQQHNFMRYLAIITMIGNSQRQ